MKKINFFILLIITSVIFACTPAEKNGQQGLSSSLSSSDASLISDPFIQQVSYESGIFSISGYTCIDIGSTNTTVEVVLGAPLSSKGFSIGSFNTQSQELIETDRCELGKFTIETDLTKYQGQELHLYSNGLPLKNSGYLYVPYKFDPTYIENCEDIKNQLRDNSQTTNVKINKCSIALEPTDVINRAITISGSNVVLDCNGATLNKHIFVQSPTWVNATTGIRQWRSIKNIYLLNCNSNSGIRITGMGANGEHEEVVKSSKRLGHTQRAQFNAPKSIFIDSFKFNGEGIKLYVSPGGTNVTLKNSQVLGKSSSVAIYFDAESGHNTIKDNYIATETYDSTPEACFLGICIPYSKERELVAVDGSAHNKFIGNTFSSLNHGGIYLYRNCGENGGVRHQTPNNNQFVNNSFYYNKYDGAKKAIHLSARNGNRNYCDLDKGYNFGSSISDLDFASDNIIAQNQFYKFSPSYIIKDDSNLPNYLFSNNDTVDVAQKRESGCISDKEFYDHGEPIYVEGSEFNHECSNGLIVQTQ